jgi:NAD(P)H-hydrate repair Nnr-like enzyme with NAD(P)H-hydrate dehydratase domain
MDHQGLPTFQRQDTEPLFPRVLYNRPVTRSGGGRLLVPGGHSGEFSLPTAIYQLSLATGIGECRVALPENLAKFLGGAPGTFFVAASPSGSLGREALGRILELSEEADAVALGASLSNNSVTAMLIEKLLTELKRPIVIFGDALTILQHRPETITTNPQALIILTMAEVFKLCGLLGIPIQIHSGGGLINKLEIIRNLQAASQCSYAVYGTEIITTTPDTQPVVTPIDYRLATTPALFYSVLATFWTQNQSQPEAGLATGAFIIHQVSQSLHDPSHTSLADLTAALEASLRATDI